MLFGVAFSGMGMYAATQLGVLRALEENGVEPAALVGVGAGAWIAGLYACNPNARGVYAAFREACGRGKRLLDPDWRGLVWGMSAGNGFQGLIRGDRLIALLEEQTGRRMLADLNLPLAIPTLALPTRKTLVFSNRCPPDNGDAVWTQQAPVSLAIRAALATPALMSPALWMGVPLVGVAGMGVAMAALKQLRVKHALCVNAGAQRPRGKLDIWEIAALSAGAHDEIPACAADWSMLTPRVPETVRMSEVEALDLCVEVGYSEAQAAIPRVKGWVGNRPGKVLAFPQKKDAPSAEWS